MTTYLRYFRDLTKGVKYLQNTAGERLLASFILPFDGLGDSARAGFLSALPGHPEQHESSADLCAEERRLIKFEGESPEDWKAYVKDVWNTYGHFTTYQGVIAAVERWGAATFPSDWTPGDTTLSEDSFARFTVTLPSSLPAFDIPRKFGDGLEYGQDAVYGSSGSARSFSLLRAAVRQAKPARSRGTVVLPFGSLPWTGTLLKTSASYPGKATVSGSSTLGRRIEIEILNTGPRGTAQFDWTLYGIADAVLDGGTATTASNVGLGSTGISLQFTVATYTDGETWKTVEGFNVVTRLVFNV